MSQSRTKSTKPHGDSPLTTIPEALRGRVVDNDGKPNALYHAVTGATADLKQELTELCEWFAAENNAASTRRYQLGVKIKRIKEDGENNHGKKYGAKAIDIVEKLFPIERDTIYKALRVVNAFSLEEVEEISSKRMKDGRPITFTHLDCLASVEDAKIRDSLLQATIEQSLTVSALYDEVRKARVESGDAVENDGRGRPFQAPKNLDDAIRQQQRSATDFVKRSPVWDKTSSLPSYVKKLDDNEVTEERANALKAHLELLQQLARNAKKQADKAKEAYQSLLAKLKAKKKTETTDSARADDGNDPSVDSVSIATE